MSNFVEEVIELLDAVPTLKTPVALLLIIIFGVPLMLFVGLIYLVDWMLQWTLKGVRLAGTVLFDCVVSAFGVYIVFNSMPSENLMGIFVGLSIYFLMFFVIAEDIKRLRRSG